MAVAEGRGEVRSLGTIANRADAVRRLLGKLGKLSTVKVCYEAGPTGYALYWQLTKLGVQSEVIAPSLVPTKPGDRDGVHRAGSVRILERREGTARLDHQDGQIACASCTCVLTHKGKPSGKTITALARELAGFVWAVGIETEKQLAVAKAA